MEKKDFSADEIDERIDEISKIVLKKIKPKPEDQKERNEVAGEIINKIKKFGFKALVVGSLAKDTNLSYDDDIDIFILFPKDKSKDFLENNGIEIGKKILEDYEIDYAEHPYVKGKYRKYGIEIVPCYDFGKSIFGEFKNIATAVDRTPYHTKYVKDKMGNLKISDEVRILKQFMKGIGVYGAESKVAGFSGYLAELLCINYGNFREVVKNASNWKFNEFIDIEDHWKGKGKILFSSSLVVIDPVDENRNVASAVNKQKMGEFIYKSREFIKNPKKDVFFPEKKEKADKKTVLEKMRDRETKFSCFLFEHGRINLNNLYTQLEKTRGSIANEFESYGFKVLNSRSWTDEDNLSIIFFEFEVWKLPKIKKHFGPYVDMNISDQESFTGQHKSSLEDGRWVSYVERKYKNINELSEKILREKKGFGDSFRKIEGRFYEDEEILLDDDFLQFIWEAIK